MKRVLITAMTLACLLVGTSSVMACGPTSTPNDQGKNASLTWKTNIFRSGIDVAQICNKTREIEEESPVEEETGKAPEMQPELKRESDEVKMAPGEQDQEVEAPNKGQETVAAEDREENKAAALHATLNIVDHSGSNSQRTPGFALPGRTHIQEIMDLSVVAHLTALHGSLPFINFYDGLRNRVSGEGAPASVSNGKILEKHKAIIIPINKTLRGKLATVSGKVDLTSGDPKHEIAKNRRGGTCVIVTPFFDDSILAEFVENRGGHTIKGMGVSGATIFRDGGLHGLTVVSTPGGGNTISDVFFDNKFYPEGGKYEFHIYSIPAFLPTHMMKSSDTPS